MLTDIILTVEKELPNNKIQIKFLNHYEWDMRGTRMIMSDKLLFNYALPYKKVDENKWTYRMKRADEYPTL